ncbi:phage shock protein PspC (stress-responsive transcriptional regulator) [Hymenobacter luteus]|uniref:Phage shock protein PspC (Stress-responsive transcriptional regulator) n=2 Tax=Hymenobacter TaxID=89966 RepID=A0A7W9T3T5_9BACT|nr:MULTISPECIES: PspC domain-containing protein [Hymenobacter]MBB4603041.1 phage shock protein PspC (stress-responsive transcriptional regulator) [Hymenobacter latericoloratus]MBB6061000.1 phage shock protein PspC (stress-responsive transcriptional regulator) [Hymenobacter luteus]
MKKNISINLQGMIFHIEEDGYDVLGRYLAEVKAHFSGYRGHEEIVADIESRIAELFAARLSGLKQVITLEDVEAMTAKMGRVRDFQTADEAEDDEEILAEAVATGSAQGTYTGARTGSGYSAGSGSTASAATPGAAEEGSKRLYRDMANRKIAGVAAGLGHYFAVNPLWVRLGFLVLLIVLPILLDNTPLDNFSEKLPVVSLLTYAILWAVLPTRYDGTPTDDDPVFKKLYRDTDTGKIGGVSSGLAAYFRVDVVLIRILFIVGLFAGGFAFPLYIILWILLPEAKTASDKLRMRGDAVTLSALDENLRNNPYAAGSEDAPANNRPVGTFLENFFQNIRPLINFLGSAIRVVAGGVLVLTGFSLLLSITIMLGVGLGVISASDNLDFGPLQPFVLFNDISPLAVLSFYLLTAIPALALLLSGLGLLLRRTILNRTATLSLLGLWLLGVVGSSVAGTRLAREFQREEEVTQTTPLPGLTKPSLVLERRQLDNDQWVDLDIVGIDSGQVPRLERIISAKGATDSLARRSAATSTLHTLRVLNDSTLSVDDHFTYQPKARYRDQEMRLRLLMPQGRTFRMSEAFADWLNSEDFVNERAPYHPEKFLFRMKGSLVECVNCKENDLRGGPNDETDEGDDYNEGRNDSDDDDNISLNFSEVEPFSTDESSYGSERQRFDETDFNHVSIVGPYRVVLRQSSGYGVRAAGNGRALRDIKIEREGQQLTIQPRNRDLFDSRRGSSDDVLLIIETPELNELELVGGTRAQINGFNSGDLRVQQAGGTQLRFQGNLQTLRLELAGGCQAALQGSADRLKLEGTGGCEVAAANFTARRADIDAVAGCKVRLHVTDELEANAVGASLIEYSGKPGTVSREAVGAASIRAID